MWNTLKRFVATTHEQGRAKFAALASDSERTRATVSTAGIGTAVGSSFLASVYFVLYAILIFLFFHADPGDPNVWRFIYFISLMFGVVQGIAIGGLLGWALALFWQGKRRKAGLTAVSGSALIMFVMALYQAQWYDPAIPPGTFLFWAIIMFSPGYLAATCVTAWGLGLLSADS